MPISIVLGTPSAFAVVALNKEGSAVPDTGITVASSDSTVATGTVNTDGTGGQAVGVAAGTCTFTATDANGLTSPPDTVTVGQDLAPASLTIQP